MLTGRSYTTSLGRPCLRESEASAGEFPLVFDGLGVFRGHFYRVIDFPNPRQNCHRTTPGCPAIADRVLRRAARRTQGNGMGHRRAHNRSRLSAVGVMRPTHCRSNCLAGYAEVLFVGWVELAKPMQSGVMGIASLNAILRRFANGGRSCHRGATRRDLRTASSPAPPRLPCRCP